MIHLSKYENGNIKYSLKGSGCRWLGPFTTSFLDKLEKVMFQKLHQLERKLFIIIFKITLIWYNHRYSEKIYKTDWKLSPRSILTIFTSICFEVISFAKHNFNWSICIHLYKRNIILRNFASIEKTFLIFLVKF